MHDTFWMVHGDGPTNFRHTTRESATAEAKRLARTNPGTTFYVLQAIDGFVRDEVRQIELDPIPF